MLANYGDLKDLEIQVQIIDGDPRQTLTAAVENHGAEMIVVGSRGVGAVKRYIEDLMITNDLLINRVLLGSVSDYLAKNSSATVVIVKA